MRVVCEILQSLPSIGVLYVDENTSDFYITKNINKNNTEKNLGSLIRRLIVPELDCGKN